MILPKLHPSVNQLLPQVPNLQMGAGPVPIPEEVAMANRLVINHLGETMNKVVEGLRSMAQYVFQTKSEKILGISGPASAAMEMAITSLLWPGRKALVLNLGNFSFRFAELAQGVGADVTVISPAEPYTPFRAEEVRKVLQASKFDVLTIVQGETSCGVKNIELEQIVKVAKEFGVLTIVDSVCTLTTMPLQMDDWGIDVVVTGGQKGLSSIAGVSLIAFSEDTFKMVQERQAPMPHWCLDPRRAAKFWLQRDYHYTAPVNGVLALYEALRLICEETLEKRFERHLTCSEALQQGLEAMGLELFTPKEWRLNSVVAIKNPESVNQKEFLQHMIHSHHIEISGAFGLPIVRVGQMGEQCRMDRVQKVLKAIGESYQHFGVKLGKLPELA